MPKSELNQENPEAGSDSEATHEWRFGRQMAGFVWQVRGRLALMVVLTVARAVCLAFVVIFLHRVISSLLESGPDQVSRFAWAAGGLLTCQVLAALCQYLGEESQRWFLEGVEIATFQWALAHLLRLPADYFRTRPLAKFVMQLDKLQSAVRVFITSATMLVVRGTAIVGIAAGVMPLSPVFAGVGIGLLVVLTLFVWRKSIRLIRAAKEEFTQDVGFINQVLRIFSSLRDLHNYGLREQALRQFEDSCKVLAARSLQVGRAKEIGSVWLNVAGIGLLAGIVAGLLFAGTGAADALTCFAALGLLLEPLSDIVRARTILQIRLARLDELFTLIEQLKEEQQHDGRTPLAGPLERIRFDAVDYHRNGVPILEGIDLEVRRGEIIGIIGRSGAGKTTLANLLLRLQDPTGGRIVMNDDDASELDLTTYWQHAAYVTQVTCQVGDTLAEDAALVRPEASDAEVTEALRDAGIDAGLARRPIDSADYHDDGHQAVWHTRSLRQRLEWARVFLRNPRLVVLDEPTSLADPVQEQRLLQSLVRWRNDRITLLISHRPATLAVCDRIMVIDAGRLVAQGPRAEMLSRWLPGLEGEGEQAG